MRSDASTAPSHRRVWPWLVLAFGVVVVILILAVLINPSAVANSVKNRVLPQVSQRLGRQVQVGNVHLTLIPHFGVTLANVSVAGADGEPPLVSSSKAAVSLKLWPLLKSRGHDIQVTSVELTDLDINLVRRPDGTWSYEDLTKGGQQKQTTPSPSAPAQPSKFVVSQLKVTNGSVHVIDEGAAKRGAADASTVAISQIDVTARDVGPGHPASMDLSAALASNQRNVRGNVTIDPLPASAASLQAGEWPKVTGHLALDKLALQHLAGLLPAKLLENVRGGKLDVTLDVSTPSPGEYAVNGKANVNQLVLRGSPSSGSFDLTAQVAPARPNSLTAHISNLRLKGPGIDLAGTADYRAAGERLRFALTGQELDLDTLLAALPPSSPSAPKEPGQPLLPPSMRAQVSKADVAGTLAIHQIKSGRLQAHDLQADAKLDNGVLTLTKGRIGLYDGGAVLDNTRVNLAPAKPEWDLRAKLTGLNLGRALQAFSGTSPVEGLANGTLTFHGAGSNWDELRNTLTGNGLLALVNGELTTGDLTKQIAQPLSSAMSVLGMAGAASKLPTSGKTDLKDVAAKFSVSNGWMTLTQPLTANTSFGTLAMGGRVGLDERLELQGKAALSQQFLASVTGGQFQPKSGIDVPLRIGGTLSSPTVEGVDWNQVAQGLVGQAVQGKAQDVQKQLENQAQQQLKGMFPGF